MENEYIGVIPTPEELKQEVVVAIIEPTLFSPYVKIEGEKGYWYGVEWVTEESPNNG